MKRVLITGSNGLLGQKLLDLYLTIDDVELIATARGENRYPRKEAIQRTENNDGIFQS